MNQIFLLLGGNLGNRLEIINQAKELIAKEIGKIIKESSVYESGPWGFSSNKDFLNQVLIVSSILSPQEAIKSCHQIEERLGRQRKSDQYESRTMDIDILFFNDEIIQEENLFIPHPRLHQRKFTLVPLVEIASKFIHPVLELTLEKLLQNCEDQSKIEKL